MSPATAANCILQLFVRMSFRVLSHYDLMYSQAAAFRTAVLCPKMHCFTKR